MLASKKRYSPTCKHRHLQQVYPCALPDLLSRALRLARQLRPPSISKRCRELESRSQERTRNPPSQRMKYSRAARDLYVGLSLEARMAALSHLRRPLALLSSLLRLLLLRGLWPVALDAGDAGSGAMPCRRTCSALQQWRGAFPTVSRVRPVAGNAEGDGSGAAACRSTSSPDAGGFNQEVMLKQGLNIPLKMPGHENKQLRVCPQLPLHRPLYAARLKHSP